MNTHPEPGLLPIFLSKIIVASFLTVSSIALLFAQKNHQILEKLAEYYWLETRKNCGIFIIPVLSIKPKTLLFRGLAAGQDAVKTAFEAVGLWYEQGWETI